MRTNESEYKRLEDAIDCLKAENAVLLDEITKLIEDRDYFEQALRRSENIVLNYLKDKERLDWLLKEASSAYVCWSIDSREQIDEAMEEAQ